MRSIIVLLLLSLLVSTTRAEDLNLFCWSEYIPQEVIDGFCKETGIKVNVENYASNEEMLAKLRSAGTSYDVVQPSEYASERMIKDGLLEPLDPAAIPNLRNVLPEFLKLPYDPQQKFTIPWMSGTVGIVINTDKIKEPVEGFRDVFQKKYAGRIVALNDNREILTWAFDCLGIDSSDITPANLDKARPLLSEWIPLVKVFDSDSPKTALLNGDVDLGIVWSGEAALCIAQDKKFKYVLPKEGSHRFVDNLAVVKGSPHKAAAMRFLDYVLRPEVSKLISEKFPYTNPNGEARKLLTKEQLANPASYPTGKVPTETFRDIGEKIVDIDRMMTELRAGG